MMMKRKYVIPYTEVVRLKLVGSLMDQQIGLGTASQEANWGDAAKENDFSSWDEEEENGWGLQTKNVWE